MNERIKELAEQAGVEYTITKVMFLTGEEEIQKFAELIVRECADVIDQVQTEGGDFIRRHFGVE
jgi:hypothetical protein